MSRLLVALAVLVMSAPLAAAEPGETVSETTGLVLGVWSDLVAAVASIEDALWGDEEPTAHEDEAAPHETAHEDEASAPEDERPSSEDTPPTYENDPLLGVAGPGRPLILKLRETVEPVPVAGGVVGDLFTDLGFTADASAPDSPRASEPLAPAAATVAPASSLPPEASAAAAAVAVVAVAGAAGAATGYAPALFEKIRRLGTLVGLGLYTRLARQELLDHDVRDRIYATVRDRPGVTLAELAQVGGVGRTAASYHLRVLAREGMVASRRDGRVRRFHANGAALDTPERLAALGHPSGQALAEAVRAEPGQDQSSLAARLGMSPSLAHWHLKRLEEANVVQKVRDGRKVRYFPASA